MRAILLLPILALAFPSIAAGDEPLPYKSGKKKPKQDHAPRHGGQVGTWKDWHLEIALPEPGLYRVWLTDAHRDPLPLPGISGTLIVREPEKPERVLPLAPDPSMPYLQATGPEAGAQDVEIRIKGLPEDVLMRFHFEPMPPMPPPEIASVPSTQPAEPPAETMDERQAPKEP